MKRMVAGTFALLLLLSTGLTAPARGQDDEGPTATLRFVVLRESDGKPLRNAEIVLHPVKKKGKQSAGEMELKTDAEGRTNVEGIPYGPIRVQVLAPRFQSFGEDYQVNKAEMEIVVKMKHPGDQVSAYSDHDDKKPQ
jgi:hypothetical protein